MDDAILVIYSYFRGFGEENGWFQLLLHFVVFGFVEFLWKTSVFGENRWFWIVATLSRFYMQFSTASNCI